MPKGLVVYKFQCGFWNESYCSESIGHLNIRSGKHISVSPVTVKKVKPSNNSTVCYHLLHCNYYSFLTTSMLWLVKTKSIYWKLKKAC